MRLEIFRFLIFSYDFKTQASIYTGGRTSGFPDPNEPKRSPASNSTNIDDMTRF